MRQDNEYQWVSATLHENTLNFDTPDGFERAIHDGFFFIEIPAGFKLNAGDLFACQYTFLKKIPSMMTTVDLINGLRID